MNKCVEAVASLGLLIASLSACGETKTQTAPNPIISTLNPDQLRFLDTKSQGVGLDEREIKLWNDYQATKDPYTKIIRVVSIMGSLKKGSFYDTSALLSSLAIPQRKLGGFARTASLQITEDNQPGFQPMISMGKDRQPQVDWSILLPRNYTETATPPELGIYLTGLVEQLHAVFDYMDQNPTLSPSTALDNLGKDPLMEHEPMRRSYQKTYQAVVELYGKTGMAFPAYVDIAEKYLDCKNQLDFESCAL